MTIRTRLLLGGLACGLSACSSTLDGPDPSLAAGTADPALVCVEQTTTITIAGSGLSPTVFDALTDDERVILPQIDLTRTADLAGAAVDEDPVRIPDDGGLVRWIDSTRMEFDLDPYLGVEPGVYDITVTNPDGSTANLADAFGGVGRPVIDEIVPVALCLAQGARAFELHGSGFLVIDGVLPAVIAGGETFEPDSMDGCSELQVPLAGVQVCSVAVVTLPQDALPLGDHQVVLTNPAPADCSSSDPITLEITPPPVITSVEPLRLCTGGGQLEINGMDFNERATVLVGGEPAFDVDFVSDSELHASFGAIGLEPGTYAVTVEQDGCSDTFGTSITVVDGIIVFFVDPPVVFNGIDTRVTIYVSGLSATPTRVVLIDAAGVETDLTPSISFTQAGRVQAVVPAALAAGSYDVLVEDDTQCASILPGGLVVTDQQILALESIEPPFGHTDSDTAVEIRAAETPDPGDVQFVQTPRAYLSPTGGGTEAAPLESVAFVSATLLTAIVPGGLPVGNYDLIVVNPTGEVGVLADAFEVTAEPPPEIDEVSPGALETSTTPQPTTIVGRFFRTPAVALTCRLSDGVTMVTPAVAIVGTPTSTEIDITVDTSDLDNGSICVVRVTNDDGTYADFSAVTITNPAQAANAIHFSAGPVLGTPRRAPAAAAGRASRAARFVYAIGGDGGTPASAIATVEASSVDLFGDLAGWNELPVSLPAGRTLARAVTIDDRFIYLVGGDTGTGPTATALRAKILDPTERPETPQLDLTLEDAGLEPGIWYYRLSAVMTPGAPQDPGGGEILASDPLVIQIPELANDRRVHVHLAWSPVPGAAGYRLYRTPMPDQASGDERLLVTLGAGTTSFTDDGTVTPAGAAPLPLGCTGAWHALDGLDTARAGHGLTVAPDPATADLFHIYAVAGGDAGGDLGSVERLSVTLVGGIQTPATWVPATALPGGTERRYLEALTADASTASKVGAEVWLYALSGSDGGSTSGAAHAIEVLAGGGLTATGWTAVDSVAPARTAYAGAIANNFLFALGGDATETTGHKANVCGSNLDPGCGGGGGVPDLGGWTSLSDINMQPRAFMGKAVQSGSLYLIGGVDAADAVLATTDQSVLGGQP